MKRERGAVFVDVRGRRPKVCRLAPKRARWPMVGEGPWERGTARALVIFVSGNAAVSCVATTRLGVGGPEVQREVTRPRWHMFKGTRPFKDSRSRCACLVFTRVYASAYVNII